MGVVSGLACAKMHRKHGLAGLGIQADIWSSCQNVLSEGCCEKGLFLIFRIYSLIFRETITQLAFKVTWFSLPASLPAGARGGEAASPAEPTLWPHRLAPQRCPACRRLGGRRFICYTSFPTWELANLDALPVPLPHSHLFTTGSLARLSRRLPGYKTQSFGGFGEIVIIVC